MSVLAGSLEIQLLTGIAQLRSDMSEAKSVVTGAMTDISRAIKEVQTLMGELLGAAAVTGLYELAKGALEGAASLEKLSQQTGETTEVLSQLQYAAKVAEVPMGGLNTAVMQLQKSMANAIAGDQLKISMFKQLGITQADLGQGTVAVMLKMSDAYAHAQDGAGKTALSMQLMKGAGEQMIPLLNMGADAIRGLMAEADSLGLTISTEFAEQAHDFEANLTKIQAAGQKLAILLAGEFVTGLTKAMQAFIDAAKEGEKFKGLLAGIQTLLTGDDLHKANVQLTQDVEKLLPLQNYLNTLKASGYADDTKVVQSTKAQIAALESSIATTQNYRHELENVEAAKKAAAERAKKDREDGDALAAATRASIALKQQEEAEYRKIKNVLDQRIAQDDLQLAVGRPLTEAEKLEIQITSQMANAKVALTAAHTAELTARVKLAMQRAKDIAEEQQEAKNAIYYHNQDEAAKQEALALDKQITDEGLRVNAQLDAQTVSLQNVNEQMRLETQMMGATDTERAIALSQLQIEQKRRADILKIQQDSLLADKDAAIARTNAQAAEATGQVRLLADLKQQLDLTQKLADEGKTLWDDLWSGGHDTLQKLGVDIKKFLGDELYELVEKKWVINIEAQITGSSVGQSITSTAAALTGNTSLLSGLPGIGGLFGAGSMAGATGASLSGAAAGVGGLTDMTAAGYAGLDVASATTLGGGASIAGGAAAGAGLMGAAAAALPYIGLALVAGQALGLFGSSHGPKTESGYGSGVPSGTDSSGAQSIASAIQTSYSTIASTLGVANTTLSNLGVFYSQDPNGTAKTQLQVAGGSFDRSAMLGGTENVGRSAADFQSAVALASSQLVLKNLQDAVGGKVGEFLKSIDVTSASLDTMNAALQTAQNVASFTKVIESFGGAFDGLKSLSVTDMDAMVQGMGGVQAAAAELQTFYDDFTPEADKQDAIWRSLVNTFTAAGVVLPSTRDAFREAVLAAQAAGDANALKTLLGAEQAFEQLYPAIQNTTAAVTTAASAWQQAYFQAWATTNKAASTTSSVWSTVFSSVNSSFSQLMGSIQSEVDKIRNGWISGTTGQNLDGAQATFNALKQQAMLGDRSAAAQLPAAAEALLSLAQSQAVDMAQLRIIQADTAEALVKVQAPLNAQNQAVLHTLANEAWGVAYVPSTAGTRTRDATAHAERTADGIEKIHKTLDKHAAALENISGALSGSKQLNPLRVRVVT